MHHTLFCDVGWDNGDLLRPCSGSPWRTTMPGHPQVMQRRNDTQRSNLCFLIHIISYYIHVCLWMNGRVVFQFASSSVQISEDHQRREFGSVWKLWRSMVSMHGYINILHIHVYIPRMIIDDPYLHQCSHGTINLLPVAMQNMTMPVSSSHGRLNMEYP